GGGEAAGGGRGPAGGGGLARRGGIDEQAVGHERGRLREPRRVPVRADLALGLIAGARAAVETVVTRRVKEQRPPAASSSARIRLAQGRRRTPAPSAAPAAPPRLGRRRAAGRRRSTARRAWRGRLPRCQRRPARTPPRCPAPAHAAGCRGRGPA